MRFIIILVSIALLIIFTNFAISPSHLQNDVVVGQKIYENNCLSCHKLFASFIGEPLYGMVERAPNKEWIYKYIRNSARMIGVDAYATCLGKKHNGAAMTMFRLNNKEIDAIYAYVNSEAKKRKDVWGNKKYFVSCK